MKKIGKGYYRSGYGRGFNKKPIVREINGKAYVKDARGLPNQTDLEGFVMVNQLYGNKFYAVGLISEHKKYQPNITDQS